MRKLIYYVATSGDRFIADKRGQIDWLEDEKWAVPGEDFGYADFYGSIDTTLMGYKTYAHVMGMDIPFPYPDTQNFVFTTHADPIPCKEVCFVHSGLRAFVERCKEDASTKDIWLIGGGVLAGELLREKLIDRLIITVIPIDLIEGIPLFGTEDWPNHAKLVNSITYANGIRQEHWQL